ncbi:ferritin-like domain-containing protein [Actinomadura nitritigenes]|uniref:ferritin-like domain-containing protein n=1 Tax=Actinomadura nitritigenes TaxID=134602 RepID=UPI003D8B0AA4
MPEAVPRLPGTVSRRGLLLGGGAVLAAPWLAGCAAEAAGPRPDVSTLVGAITSEQDLIATYEAAKAADASLARRLDPVLAHHRQHLTVLKRHYVPGSGRRAHEGGTIPPPHAAELPQGPAEILTALRLAEDRAAAARRADTAKAPPGLAQLLASIGACEAGHAETVRAHPPADPAKSSTQAIQTALAAEHAAVYGYGVLGGRLRGALQQAAKTYWDAHRAQRDKLVSILSAQPVAAAAGYRLPIKVTNARSAARLAAALEDDLVPAYVGLAGASAADLRVFAADSAERSAARSAKWRASAGDGTPSAAFPGLPPAALSPRPEPGE